MDLDIYNNEEANSEDLITTITGYTFTVEEDGQVRPILFIKPVQVNGVMVKTVKVGTWIAFDNLKPRIGNKVKVIPGSFVTNLELHSLAEYASPIGRPEVCPLCEQDLQTNETKTMLRCVNEHCDSMMLRRVYAYYKYCCLVTTITFRDVVKLYLNGFINSIRSIYSLTEDSYIRIGFSKESAKDIIKTVNSNRHIPVQNLIYAIMIAYYPYDAVRLSSLVTNRKTWYITLMGLVETPYIRLKDKSADRLKDLHYKLVQEITNNMEDYQELSKEIEVILLPKKLTLTKYIFVIADLESFTKEYLSTMIKLNGGRVEFNFNRIVWADVDFIIGDVQYATDNLKKGVKYGTPTITEDEFRYLISTKLPDEPSLEKLELASKSMEQKLIVRK
nr:MAG TPA: DNA ligase [Caudoviricetes sp.]